MTDKERRRIINKTLNIIKDVLSDGFCVGLDVNGEPYLDRKIATREIRKALEERL